MVNLAYGGANIMRAYAESPRNWIGSASATTKRVYAQQLIAQIDKITTFKHASCG